MAGLLHFICMFPFLIYCFLTDHIGKVAEELEHKQKEQFKKDWEKIRR